MAKMRIAAALAVGVMLVALALALALGPAQGQSPSQTRGEVGPDMQLSSMGPPADPDFDAITPAAAWDSANDRFLVVWAASDDVEEEYEIWGQLLDAEHGYQMGLDFQISFVGPADDASRDALEPDVAYNSSTGEYLVVWAADHLADGDFEIYCRRVTASPLGLVGSMARVSVMGPGVDSSYDARQPAVAYNHVNNEYLIVWHGDEGTSPLVDDEFEIWGQAMDASAEKIGSQFKISSMGAVGSTVHSAYSPDLAFRGTDSPLQYLVVWEGDESTDGEFEIWAQRVLPGGGLLGSELRISDMGANGDPDHDATDPAVAYNSVDDHYLVVWEGDNSTDSLFDIFAQRLEDDGTGVGENDFVISTLGDGPNADYDAINPAVVYNGIGNEYFVVWHDDVLGDGEFEVFGSRIDGATGDFNQYDTRLSDMGSSGQPAYQALDPAVIWSGGSNIYLAAWSGDDSVDGEFEIWAQRFDTPLVFADGFETGSTSVWSDAAP